ncbi:LOW QUALITY PROTEIN: hypothetical protein HID58_034232 [Brassica napus]|uniref:Uncharacterized protein n=1 Tax=Brassica napus TaxID=3708 RepID=A0ABQ8C3C3_BRANA|nr:LOW QUALITY PROTEIN: hypothetical protein HID58_034232 [Brassica napus]
MKVTVALLVNSCGLDQWLSWSMCAWIFFDVVGRVVDEDQVVDEDLVVSGCVDVVDVTGRVADEALSGGYKNGNRGRIDIGGGD